MPLPSNWKTHAALLLAIVVAACAPGRTVAQQFTRIPDVQATTFADESVKLPQGLHGKVGILVVGFTQASRPAVTDWGKRLASDYYSSPVVSYYIMPVLASAPKMLRGFIAGRIKADVSERGRHAFLPLYDHEAEWKSATGFDKVKADDAYVLLVDEQGQVRWRTQGPVTDSTYAELQRRIKELPPAR